MYGTQIIYNDIDIEKIKKISKKSAQRMQHSRESQLKEAVKDFDISYIESKLQNVSTIKLLKMLLKKIILKYHRRNNGYE